MASLAEFRQQHPEYNSQSDAALAVALHRKYYNHVPMTDYLNAVGLDRGDVLYELRTPGDQWGDYLRSALSKPGAGETAEQAAVRQGGKIADRRPGMVEGMALGTLNGATGWGDEIVAAGAAALDPLVHGDRGKDFGQRFDAYRARQSGLLDNFREDNPAAAIGSEIAGGMGTALLAAPAKLFPQLIVGGIEGANYGAGNAEGGPVERGAGALAGTGFGVGGALLGRGLGVLGGQVASNIANRQARKVAIQTAPTAKDWKVQAKGSYKASEATGAVIGQASFKSLKTRARSLFQDEGLVFPSGRLAEGYPKLKNAWRAIQEYSAAPVDIKQAQRIHKMIRKAAKATDPDEARVGLKLLDEFESFIEALPPSSFTRGDGQLAVQQWTKARNEWSRFKRTDTLEQAIEKAATYKGGFGEGLRAQFASIVNSPKKRMGFKGDEIAEMRKVAEGAPLDDFLRFLQRGGALPAYMLGHLAVGPVAGIAMGLGKMVGNLGIRAASNRSARGAAEAVRAGVATPGGLPKAIPRPPASGQALPASLGGNAANRLLPDQRAALARALMSAGGGR